VSELLSNCRSLSPLFRDREQQDSHECLRCILLYIQEVTRAINRQRVTHYNITRSDGRKDGDLLPSAGEANSTAYSAKNSSLSESVSPQSNSTLQPVTVSSAFPTSDTAVKVTVSILTPQDDCLVKSLYPKIGSRQNPALQPSTNAEPVAANSSSSVGAKKTSVDGKIKNYFRPAPPAPKTASDIVVTTRKVTDFVDVLFEGKSERTTRCLECECQTHCTETFQDVEVVAQKAVTRAENSKDESSDTDDDDNGEK